MSESLKNREYFLNNGEKYLLVYYNPDSDSGGQIVKNVIHGTNKVLDLIDRSKDIFEFLDNFEAESTQTCLDKGEQEYSDWVDYLTSNGHSNMIKARFYGDETSEPTIDDIFNFNKEWDIGLKIIRSQVTEPTKLLEWFRTNICQMKGVI